MKLRAHGGAQPSGGPLHPRAAAETDGHCARRGLAKAGEESEGAQGMMAGLRQIPPQRNLPQPRELEPQAGEQQADQGRGDHRRVAQALPLEQCFEPFDPRQGEGGHDTHAGPQGQHRQRQPSRMGQHTKAPHAGRQG